MSRLISRRAFASGVVAAGVAATGVVALSARAAAIPSTVRSKQRYAVEVRHYGQIATQGMTMAFWIRVIDKSDFSASVPVTVQLATDSALKGVIWLGTGVASQAGSHIVRVSTLLPDQQLRRNAALYAGVWAGDPSILAKVKQVRKYRAPTA
jgi:phosphodiesterase/alkaline phosphatase D-like protein